MAKGSRLIATGRVSARTPDVIATKDPVQRFLIANFHHPGAPWTIKRVAELKECGVDLTLEDVEKILTQAPRYAAAEARAAKPGAHDPIVYFIAFGDRIKIGTTTNLKGRLEAIPHDEVLATVPGSFPVERGLHARFAHLRITGEWFHRGDDLMRHIDNLRRDTPDRA